MIEPIRTERTFGVTAALKPAQRRNLLALLNSEVYADLLDVLEMVCIEIETRLINTDPADDASVLANHKMAKAAWQMFTHLQEKISSESQSYLQSIDTHRPIPSLTSQEQWIENTLNPTIPLPDDEETLV
jgi:hypothetical protein